MSPSHMAKESVSDEIGMTITLGDGKLPFLRSSNSHYLRESTGKRLISHLQGKATFYTDHYVDRYVSSCVSQ